jgi:TRAP-type mannitol/chloroaromatic compound transport system permease small subunit
MAALQFLVKAVGGVGALGVLLIMVQVVVDTSARFLLGSTPVPGTFEYVQYWWMPLVAFGGLAMAEAHNEHIAAPVVFDRLSTSTRKAWLLVGNAFMVISALLLTVYVWTGALDAQKLGESRGAANIPVWPLRYWVAIGAALYGLQIIIGTIRELRALDEDRAAATPVEAEDPLL